MVSSCVVTEDMPVPMIDQMINRLMLTRVCLSNKSSPVTDGLTRPGASDSKKRPQDPGAP
jgi:hypothetical protein